jgi:segregation and condensation protein A
MDFTSDRPALRADVSIFDLVNAVNTILKRLNQREDLRDIFEDKWSVSEKIEDLIKLIAEKPALKFSELFAGATSRSEVVCTFLALLELIRLKQLACVQPENFGEIEITKAVPQPIVAPTTETAPQSEPANPHLN